MQSLGLQNLPSRTLERPQNETEVQRLNRLMTQEVSGTDSERLAAFVYRFAGLVIFVAAAVGRSYIGGDRSHRCPVHRGFSHGQGRETWCA
jgi:hypothetical protein